MNFGFYLFIYMFYFFNFLMFFLYTKSFYLKNISYEYGCFMFIMLLVLFLNIYDPFSINYYFILNVNFLIGLSYTMGLDIFSFFLVVLLFLLNFICIQISWNSIKYRFNDFVFLHFLNLILLIHVFCSLDLFFFFFCFESVLIPMFLIIGVWGSRQRKIHSSYQFFFFTMIGSIWFFISILFIYIFFGTSGFFFFMGNSFYFSSYLEFFLWICFFVSFAVKIPIMPIHIWLPEAHVEAPTFGSVLLAGILLKMGGFGILRYMLTIFSYSNLYFMPIVFLFCLISLLYSSLITIRQIDIKKIIAYSSIAHMNLIVIGLFNFDFQSVFGSYYFMLSHGIVSSALFFLIGIIYDRSGTRILYYLGRLVEIMPLFSFFFFFFSLANLGFPGTSSFIGEFLILSSLFFKMFFSLGFITSVSTILAAIYSIWLFNRMCFYDSAKKNLFFFADVNKREFSILLLFMFLAVIFGLYPFIIYEKCQFFLFFFS